MLSEKKVTKFYNLLSKILIINIVETPCIISYLFTGYPDQIGRNFKMVSLHNQKTYRKFKYSFGIVRNRTINIIWSI